MGNPPSTNCKLHAKNHREDLTFHMGSPECAIHILPIVTAIKHFQAVLCHVACGFCPLSHRRICIFSKDLPIWRVEGSLSMLKSFLLLGAVFGAESQDFHQILAFARHLALDPVCNLDIKNRAIR